MAMGGVGEAMLLNAAIGGTVSAVAGGDPLKGALMGGLTGGVMSGLPSLLGGGTSAVPGATGVTAAPTMNLPQGITALNTQTGVAAAPTMNLAPPVPDVSAVTAAPGSAAYLNAEAANPVFNAAPAAPEGFSALREAERASASLPQADMVAQEVFRKAELEGALAKAPATTPDKSLFGGLKDKWNALSPEKKLLYGGMGGVGLMSLLQGAGQNVPGADKYSGPLSAFKYDRRKYIPSPFAGGGIVALMRGGPSDLGSYSDGGRMLKGPGDGMSDNIPGVIGGKRPARLADGEFVVPADVVSHLGNGSTDAGAKQLYAMMDRVRAKRTGTKRQGKQINPSRLMPA